MLENSFVSSSGSLVLSAVLLGVVAVELSLVRTLTPGRGVGLRGGFCLLQLQTRAGQAKACEAGEVCTWV